MILSPFPTLLLLSLLLTASVRGQEPASPPQYRAFWADAFHYGYKNPSEADRLLEDAVRARANALFVQMRRRADSYYLRTVEVPAQDGAYAPGFDALEYLIARAHERGIQVHAWFVVYPLWPTTIAPPLDPRHIWHRHGPRAAGEDMWMQVNAAGQVLGSFDPGHPGVQQYLASVITSPLEHYDVDGIHLDYIRYDETGNYGGNPVSLARFQRQELRTAAPAPNDAGWADFRRRQVTQLMRQIYLRAVAVKPRMAVSAALISWGNGPLTDAGFRSTDAYATVFQDWRAWLEEGIIDLAMPMHYFRETTNAAFLDRWLDFARSRQYGRGYLPGLAPYLNTIPNSLAQIGRVLTLAGQGGAAAPLGVTLYSYASTNTLDAAGLPTVANSEFYSQLGDLLAGSHPSPPELPWKTRPTAGHLLGTVENAEAPTALPALADGATVAVSSDTRRDGFTRVSTVDGTGFYGFADLPPDRYRVRLERGGRRVAEATPLEVRAGEVTRAPAFRLAAADYAAALPRIDAAPEFAAPGEWITIEGANLIPASGTSEYAAPGVPLPASLGGAQVLVNGASAPLLSATATRLVAQMPAVAEPGSGWWALTVRQQGGGESLNGPWALAARATSPAIVRVEWLREAEPPRLDIFATGLGVTEPPLEAGRGADPSAGPLPNVRAAVEVWIEGLPGVFTPQSATLAPFQPGLYQVTVALPGGSGGGAAVRSGAVLRLRAGDREAEGKVP